MNKYLCTIIAGSLLLAGCEGEAPTPQPTEQPGGGDASDAPDHPVADLPSG